MKQYSRVYASIDLDAVQWNMEQMHQRLSDKTKILAVIKADGYGHGAVEIAHQIQQLEYLHGFCVATVEEAQILKRHEVKKPIVILGYSFAEQYEAIVANDFQPTVISYEMAKNFSDIAVKMNKECRIHIKIDTGMSRLGYPVNEETACELERIGQLPNIVLEGIFTHFSRADETDKTTTHEQMQQFAQIIKLCQERKVTFQYHHCSNSAGIIDSPETHMDIVRAGIILYGLWPSDEVHKENLDLHPLMELKSQVTYVKTLPAGREISYGGTFVTKKDTKVATIPVGYGDGYPRSLSGKGVVLIQGKRAPILGRVCMDQFMVDVTDIPDVLVGTTVTLLGRDGDDCITMEELGDTSGRFNYEFACDIGKRIPRVYLSQGEVIGTKDYFDE